MSQFYSVRFGKFNGVDWLGFCILVVPFHVIPELLAADYDFIGYYVLFIKKNYWLYFLNNQNNRIHAEIDKRIDLSSNHLTPKIISFYIDIIVSMGAETPFYTKLPCFITTYAF